MDADKQNSPERVQLNIIGFFALAILAITAWNVARPLTWFSIIPLAFFAYAGYQLAFELIFSPHTVPTLTTGFVVRGKIADILRRDAEEQGKGAYTVVDLGSGRGWLTRCIAKKIPQARVIGIERALIPFWESVFIQRIFGPENLVYRRGDFWNFKCGSTDAVVLFLTPQRAKRAGEKLERELRAGSLIVSYNFPLLGAWTPVEVVTCRSPFKETIYVYRK